MSRFGSATTMEPPRMLMVAAVTTSCICLAALLPMQAEHRSAVMLLAAWLLCAALIRTMHRRSGSGLGSGRSIPLRFSGDLGAFTLRSYGDGRHVEVRAGERVVARVIASDDGDELVIDPDVTRSPDLVPFGAALGRAIEMVAAADGGGPARPGLGGAGRTPAAEGPGTPWRDRLTPEMSETGSAPQLRDLASAR